MSNENHSKSWWQKSEYVTELIVLLGVACFGLLVIELFYHRHTEFDFEGWFGFYALFGFLAYCVLIFAAKRLRRLIKRPENYYDD